MNDNRSMLRIGNLGCSYGKFEFRVFDSDVYLFRLEGTSLRRYRGADANASLVSDFIAEGPPVPIPNTEVKLC